MIRVQIILKLGYIYGYYIAYRSSGHMPWVDLIDDFDFCKKNKHKNERRIIISNMIHSNVQRLYILYGHTYIYTIACIGMMKLNQCAGGGQVSPLVSYEFLSIKSYYACQCNDLAINSIMPQECL